ncbi:MAG: hypothetical protein HOE62_22145 [Alphaproteobacteria bacterium]|jgi:hypothetical protein|nr:hypothetical protein [Alphaproteobacteria bacterium]MBT4020668.1 hypothetical protein [Alphaproteobacteria bacterium]MBT4965317.1 hypothetical protein [Alphaproteobacteria bacterium]MBT5160449.1 hypothetical protein [Alphaproteobacteria bacterium]MBT5919648.1 hypothetical protein [Alphaproteobacteria bacterium]
MPAWTEISSSLYGVWRLARRDPGGMNYLNLSVDGFWRSFFAAVLAAPTYLLILLVQRASSEKEMTWLPELFSYALGWIIWPLVALGVLRLMGLGNNFIPYIIAYNWANVLHINFLLPIAIVAHGGVMPDGIAVLLSLIATLAVLIYMWWVAKVALGATTAIAIGIVVLDVLMGFMLSRGTEALFA